MLNPARTFGFLLKDVSRRNVQRFEQRAGALGLTLPQCRVLVDLADHQGVSQVQLAELTDIEPMTLVRILDRMESDGWLERRSDPADRRARRLYLRPAGKPLVEEILNMVELTREEAFAGISRAQADLLITLLEKVQSNLASLEPLPPADEARARRGRDHAPTARIRRARAASRP